MKIVFLLVIVLIACGLLYIRFAPSEEAKWHTSSYPMVPGDHASEGGFAKVMFIDAAPQDALVEMDRIIMETPRTTRLAGTTDQGMVTYVTRSLLMGFPDYTTVEAQTVAEGTILIINSRLRFGQSDMGVNQKRLMGWMQDFNLS
ncbi:DUF1499 domain-containing protein [Parasulfitobacter algicola]|uniref:DUF1499 domain-containing protein n=1 Tax=Parasulfitobacter algicola TaxID=2614809 RepID=A0ABX2IRH7_9RHOB|nr:DUF1499 domain-containing protein [Sulfitobacter algicola]NSX55501.1 DUF1499 domain-containing protein [Sulfitobacter algicola]